MTFGKKTGIQLLVGIAALFMLSACGSSSSNSSSPAPSTTTITGSVFAAPVSNATVVVLNSAGTTTIAGPVTTASDGTYSIAVPSDALGSDLIFASTSGTFTDEATGSGTTAGSLSAYISAGTLTTGTVSLDPSSTVIADLVKNHGKTADQAKTLFSQGFGYAPDCAVTPQNTPATGTNNAQRLSALRAMAFSQLTNYVGLTPDKQFDLLSALADDLSDGTLNGKQATAGITIGSTPLPEDVENRFERALVSMLTNTTVNLTGLTPDLVAPLPFGKVALTGSYRVEYIPGMMPAAQGKTNFQLKISNLSDGTPASGLMVTLMPMMHMSTMKHSTPVDAVNESSTPGTYNCASYYLMGSGAAIGFWELQAGIGGMMGETATFYPAVGMAMGTDTIRATLYGPDDIVSGMTGTQYNRYYLFRDGSVTATSGTLNLFIAHGESMNMRFVPAAIGAVMSSPTGTITAMTLQASTDASFATSVSATNTSGGHWSLSGLSGLVSGQTTTVYVKLSVNGQDKTTNGAAGSGTNAYASFAVTPQ